MSKKYQNQVKNTFRWPQGYWNTVQSFCDKLIDPETSFLDLFSKDMISGFLYATFSRLHRRIISKKSIKLKHTVRAPVNATTLDKDSIEYVERVIETINESLGIYFDSACVDIGENLINSEGNYSAATGYEKYFLPFIAIITDNVVAEKGYLEHLTKTGKNRGVIKTYFMLYAVNYYLSILLHQDETQVAQIPKSLYANERGKPYEMLVIPQDLTASSPTEKNPFLMKFFEYSVKLAKSEDLPAELRIHYLMQLIKFKLQNGYYSKDPEESIEFFLRYLEHLIHDRVTEPKRRRELSESIYKQIVDVYASDKWCSSISNEFIDLAYKILISEHDYPEVLMPLKQLQADTGGFIANEINAKIWWPFSTGYNYLLENLPAKYARLISSSTLMDILEWSTSASPDETQLLRVLAKKNTTDGLSGTVIGKMINRVCRDEPHRIMILNQLIDRELLTEQNFDSLINVNSEFMSDLSCLVTILGKNGLLDSGFQIVARNSQHINSLKRFFEELESRELLRDKIAFIDDENIQHLDELTSAIVKLDDEIRELEIPNNEIDSDTLKALEKIANDVAPTLKWCGDQSVKALLYYNFGLEIDECSERAFEIEAALIAFARVDIVMDMAAPAYKETIASNYHICRKALAVKKFMEQVIKRKPRTKSAIYDGLVQKYNDFTNDIGQATQETITRSLIEFLQATVIQPTAKSPARITWRAKKAIELLNGRFADLRENLDLPKGGKLDKSQFLNELSPTGARPFSQTSDYPRLSELDVAPEPEPELAIKPVDPGGNGVGTGFTL